MFNAHESKSLLAPIYSRKLQLIVAFIIIVISIGVGLRINHSTQVPELSAPIAPTKQGAFLPTKEQLVNLKIEPVQSMAFRTERSTEGYIAYNDDAMTQVFSPYSGRVTRVIAKPGDLVKKGAPLMAVAASEFVQAQNDLITAVNALKTAQEQATLTSTSEKRQHELYLAKSGALKDWLQSQTDLATTQNNLRIAETTLDTDRDRLRIMGKTDEEISALETNPSEHLLNPESLVLAPISGTVTQRQVGVGQNISSIAGGAANPVFTIGNLSTLWLVANVREADAPLMRIGQPIEVHVMAYPKRKFEAKVTWVSPTIDSSTHRLPVRAEINNSDGTLKAMMFANFSIITGTEAASLAVPQSAVVYMGEETRVYVVNSDGTIIIRPIKVGRQREDGMLEVNDGLTKGEKIVTSGTLFIDRAVTAETGDAQ